ncbi:MAG: hypothetical protein J6I72_08160, partial [Muribaculaceae bacterium]|nr:hypothetical protein [Muribaculaceae bacterium]
EPDLFFLLRKNICKDSMGHAILQMFSGKSLIIRYHFSQQSTRAENRRLRKVFLLEHKFGLPQCGGP